MEDYTALLETALNLLDNAVYIYTAQGKALFLNKTAKQFMGIKDGDLYKNHDLLKIVDITAEESTTLSCIRTQSVVRNRLCRYKTMDGREHYTFNTAHPVFQGNVLTAAIDFEDDVIQMEKKRQLLEQLQNQAREFVVDHGVQKKKHAYTLEDFAGHAPSVLELKKTIQKVAPQDSNIMIYGETGTGKEIIAQSIHGLSQRRNKPLIVLNCSAVPETLVESILFGTVPGAYTGATNRQGLLEAANGGTLFLDELNSMSPAMQAKLLRVLQEGVFRRVGETKERQVDLRVISTCNEDPFQLIRTHKLREDLFFRLATMVLRIPPLRDRISDLELLCKEYLSKYSRRFAYPLTSISPQALWTLQQYDWPGNVRELYHVLDYAMNLAEGNELTTDLLPDNVLPGWSQKAEPAAMALRSQKVPQEEYPKLPGQTLSEKMASYEIHVLKETLARNHGNITKAAKELGLARQNLQYRMKKYGIRD